MILPDETSGVSGVRTGDSVSSDGSVNITITGYNKLHFDTNIVG